MYNLSKILAKVCLRLTYGRDYFFLNFYPSYERRNSHMTCKIYKNGYETRGADGVKNGCYQMELTATSFFIRLLSKPRHNLRFIKKQLAPCIFSRFINNVALREMIGLYVYFLQVSRRNAREQRSHCTRTCTAEALNNLVYVCVYASSILNKYLKKFLSAPYMSLSK